MWPISASFASALRSPVHTFRVTMQVLDTDFNIVREFTDTGDADAPDNYLVDGSVDLDISRGARRAFTASLLNPEGIFSPGSDWGGLFYVNRLIRFYRGISYGTSSELVPIGTFMIDHADVVVERNMSMVVLTGQDLWKKVAKSQWDHPKSWAAGTDLVALIKEIAGYAGVTRFVDDLSDDRTGDSRELNKKFSVEQGDYRGDAITKLAAAYGLDVYFDPLGRLVIADYRSPEDTRVVWTYDPDQDGMMLMVRPSYRDDGLFNHALVVATGGGTTITSHMRDTDPRSVTNVNRIGDRVFKYETDTISTQAAADAACRKVFYANVLVNEDVTMDAICNPALDGNDVIAVRESQYSKVNSTYRIRTLTIPFSSSRQTAQLGRTIKLS